MCIKSGSQADTFGRGPAHDRLGIAQGREQKLDHLKSHIGTRENSPNLSGLLDLLRGVLFRILLLAHGANIEA